MTTDGLLLIAVQFSLAQIVSECLVIRKASDGDVRRGVLQ